MAQAVLYRHHDASGRLLYVGISIRGSRRQSEHRVSAHWARQIASVTTEDHATWGDAHAAERLAIRAEAVRARLARSLPHPSSEIEFSHRSAAHRLGLRPNELRQLAPFPGSTDPLTGRDVVEIGWRLIVGAAIVDPEALDEYNTFLPPRMTAKLFGRGHPLVDASKLAEGGAHQIAAEVVARHHTKFRSTPLALEAL